MVGLGSIGTMLLAAGGRYLKALWGLTTSGDMDMLNGNLLLALASMLIEGGNLLKIKCHELGCMLQGHILTCDGLVRVCRAVQALGDCFMGADHLNRQHALQPISGVQILIEFDGTYNFVLNFILRRISPKGNCLRQLS